MRSLNIFGRDRPRPSSPSKTPPLRDTADAGALKDLLAESEAKALLYNRLSVKSPAPLVSHAAGTSSERSSLFDKLQHGHGKLARESIADHQLDCFEFPTAAADRPDDEPVVPSPRVFRPSTKRFVHEEWEARLPTVVQCAVHLELLECFWALKHRVTVEYAEGFDVIFGYQGRGARAWREGKGGWGRDAKEQLRNEVEWVESERERVWRAFVEVAVQRFHAWWTRVDAVLCAQPRAGQHRPANFTTPDAIQRWQRDVHHAPADSRPPSPAANELPADVLPPLDILLVWYAFVLLPSVYTRNCDASPRSILWDVAFPWTAIHEAIETDKWLYNPNAAAQSFFCELMGSDFDLLASLRRPLGQEARYPHPQRSAPCPKCGAPIVVPVTDPVGNTGWCEQKSLVCNTCCAQSTRASIIESSAFEIDLAEAVHEQSAFLATMHQHLWIRSPALAGNAYWESYITTDIDNPSLWMHPSGTLERAIVRLRDFIASKGNVTSTSLPLDVDLVWRTLLVSPMALTHLHPKMTGRQLLQLATCRPRNADRRKHLQNAKRYGPAEWERCLCWTCEASRTEKDAAEKSYLSSQLRRKKSNLNLNLGWRELDGIEKITHRKKVQLVVHWFAEVEMARRENRRLPAVAALVEELENVGASRRLSA